MNTTRKSYPSDVTDAEWEFLLPYLTLMREDAPQREYPLRELFDALRYLVKTGCQWRFLPHDFPPWAAVYQQAQLDAQIGQGGCAHLSDGIQQRGQGFFFTSAQGSPQSNPLSNFTANGLQYAANENEVPSNWLEMRGNFDIQLKVAYRVPNATTPGDEPANTRGRYPVCRS